MGDGDGSDAGSGAAPPVVDRTLVPSLDERRLMGEALPILGEVAGKIHRQLGAVIPVDDLKSLGHVALVGLVRRYQSGAVPFGAYLRVRLRWAMLDGIRRDSHGRSVAGRARALAGASRLIHPSATEDSQPPLMTERGYRQQLSTLLRDHAAVMGIALMASAEGLSAQADSSADPEKTTLARAAASELREAVAALPDPRQRALVERHYFGDESFDAIADSLGISKSWASRLHGQAIQTLARRLAA
jgi:RNA polymerase sigma factor for flagellar operon FliA